MPHTLVLITLSDSGIATIRSTPGLVQQEMEFVQRWKAEQILERFFISVSKRDAVLLFQGVEEARVRELIASLPYFPFMERIEYHVLEQQF
jgi:hypothetical protein